jgi:hypothetical protein
MLKDILGGFMNMFYGEGDEVEYTTKQIIRFYAVFTGVIVIAITLMLL